jgi:hypothetical protein
LPKKQELFMRLLILSFAAVLPVLATAATAQKGEEKMKAVPQTAKGYDMQKSIKSFADPKQTGKGGYDQQKSIKN